MWSSLVSHSVETSSPTIGQFRRPGVLVLSMMSFGLAATACCQGDEPDCLESPGVLTYSLVRNTGERSPSCGDVDIAPGDTLVLEVVDEVYEHKPDNVCADGCPYFVILPRADSDGAWGDIKPKETDFRGHYVGAFEATIDGCRAEVVIVGGYHSAENSSEDSDAIVIREIRWDAACGRQNCSDKFDANRLTSD